MTASSSLADQIRVFFAKHPKESFKLADIVKRLGLDHMMTGEVRSAIRKLEADGMIRREHRKRYGHAIPPSVHHVSGTVRLAKQGVIATLLPPHEGEVFIGQKFIGTAMDGDTVSISLFPEPLKQTRQTKPATGKMDRREGEVVSVLERGRKPIVGELRKSKHQLYVVPDDRRIKQIVIPKSGTENARTGDKVVVMVEEWDSPYSNPEGKVVEVLGRVGEVRAEMMSVVRMFHLPLKYPQDVLAETEKISSVISRTEAQRRLDLRDQLCFTIDPEDAKDFDDAISLEMLPDGNFKLGVHIADVSHFVKEGTALDEEAERRGTSVYLADGVVPMLPEKISNHLCSLRPNEDRLTYSAMMIVSPRGVVKDYTIEPSIIHSKRRFTYEEVQGILETGRGDYADSLLEMNRLAKTLFAKRLREGGIDFESAESKFKFDDQGKPSEILKKERLDAHRLVEDFMLLANKTVAIEFAKPKSLLPQTSKHKSASKQVEQLRPALYRIHDFPDPARIEELASFVANFGYSLNVSDGVTSKALQKLLQSVKGKEEEAVINQVAIRSMAKAIYSETNIGHFGLAFRHYTHFTSPIRRYPDLIVHRLLKEYSREMTLARRQHWKHQLSDICAHSSLMEQRAMEAERESVKVMQVEYMKRHLGDEFNAVISGVAHFGLFVQITDLLVEGLIRVRDLEDDYYLFDEKNYALIGRTHRHRYRLGDKVRVQVVRVDPEEREIDFRLVPRGRK